MAIWCDCKLGDLLEIKHGYAFEGEYFATAGSHIVLTPGNFFDAGGFKDKGDNEKWYTGPVPPEYLLKKGDLIVAMTEQAEGLLGSSAIVPRDGTYLHNQRLGLVQIRDRQKADSRFLYYIFNSKPVRQQIRGSASGTKIRHTAPSRIADVRVRVPSLALQRRIGSILSAYDDLIENNTRRIQVLERMAQAVYREWFVNFRFPGHAEVKLVDSPLGPIPQGWVPSAFTDLAQILSGGTPSTRVPEYWDGEIPWFTPRDATDSFYVLDTDKHITWLGVDNCASDAYPRDTIFITARGTVGKLALAAVPMAVNQSCYAVRGKPGYGQLLVYLMLHSQVSYLKKNTGGATFDTIVTDTFKRMSVLKPPPPLAQAFEEVIGPFFERIRLLHFQNANLRRTRDLLLPRLLSGQVDVSKFTDE